jgi:hypothetical protein
MQEELTRLLRAVPFAPFVVHTRDGESQTVTSVERLSAGRNVCAYVDEQGFISLIPIRPSIASRLRSDRNWNEKARFLEFRSPAQRAVFSSASFQATPGNPPRSHPMSGAQEPAAVKAGRHYWSGLGRLGLLSR